MKKELISGKKSRVTASFSRKLLILCLFLSGIVGLCCCGNSDSEPSDSPTTEIKPNPGNDLYGFIGDKEGKAIEGVVVTDGYACTQTDSKGIYQMKKNSKATFVYYTAPTGYKASTTFYQKLLTNKGRYDFKLNKLTGDETNFYLICIGDPQVTSNAEVARFKDETMADIKNFVDASSKPVYGLCMGDMVGDKPDLQAQMKTIISSTNMPLFTTIGNHDKVAGIATSEPRNSDLFCLTFGPLNYSFNRGDVHFVCLDNIIYSNSTTYTGGFTDSQVQWLKQDLSYVPKSKMVIVYYHIPLRNTTSIANRDKILELLNGYSSVHLMSGHTHYSENCMVTAPIQAYEHIHAAACGAWWHSVINGDGTPNGYAVYEVSGNKITNWYYKSVKFDKNYQIRLHKGNASFGGTYGSFTYGQKENTIIANIWNADDNWTVNVYEDGVNKGAMQKVASTSTDAWSQGYHIGVVGRNSDNYSQPAKHLYLYQMTNPNAKIKVEATDGFGNKYVQDKITDNLNTAAAY